MAIGRRVHGDEEILVEAPVFRDDERTVDACLDARFALRDLMTTELRTIQVTDTVGRAAELLAEGAFHCVPVVEHDGTLVGIVTTTDLIRRFIATC